MKRKKYMEKAFLEKVYKNARKKYMQLALQLAKKGKGHVHPNPLVGCVIVKPTEKRLSSKRKQMAAQILGQGFHQKFGAEHAEVNAIKDAWKKHGKDSTNNAEMFVTLEPCVHFGKTPPCVDAIIASGIKKVFVAMKDVNPIVSGKGLKKLKENGIEVDVGLCKEDAMELNEAYIKWMKTKTPFVLLKIALTKQGFISWGNGKRKRISGKKGLEKVQELRNEFDAVLVGINTVLMDNPKLTCRIKGGRNPIRIVLDPDLKIPLNANFLKKNAERIVFCGKKASKEKEKKIENMGAKVIRVNEKNNLLDLKQVLKKIGKMQIVSVLVEGGQKINSSFLEKKLADKVMFIVGKKNLKNGLFFVNEHVKRIELKNVKSYKLGEDFVIEGRM